MTASHFKDCCMAKTEEAARSLALRLLNPKKIHSAAMDHGIINEEVAVCKYIEYTGNKFKVEESGLIVSKERPYLAVSPDRLLGQNDLIEVKCPYSSRNSVINPVTVPYLYFDEKGSLCLKPDHQYMYQIQGQLSVAKKKVCYLVVYTYCDLKIISIEQDPTFISVMLSKLDLFYEKYFLPALLDKYYYRHYSEYILTF